MNNILDSKNMLYINIIIAIILLGVAEFTGFMKMKTDLQGSLFVVISVLSLYIIEIVINFIWVLRKESKRKT